MGGVKGDLYSHFVKDEDETLTESKAKDNEEDLLKELLKTPNLSDIEGEEEEEERR